MLKELEENQSRVLLATLLGNTAQELRVQMVWQGDRGNGSLFLKLQIYFNPFPLYQH